MASLLLYAGALAVIGGIALGVGTAVFATTADVPRNQLVEEMDNPFHVARQLDLERSLSDRFIGPVGEKLMTRLRNVTPVGKLETIQEKLVLGGLEESKWTAEYVLLSKLVLTIIGGLCGAAILSGGLSTGNIVKAGLAVGVGYLVPETLLSRRVEDRQKTIQGVLPDFIDQITVSVEAGLGFDGAMQRAGEEGKGILADELLKVVNDIQIGMSREEALEALVQRTQVPDLRQFVLSIRQATRYGLPIARVLRVQSQEMREKRRARAEEKAMQIPVKITFPLVFFILPALFLVILGPAGIQISQNF